MSDLKQAVKQYENGIATGCVFNLTNSCLGFCD